MIYPWQQSQWQQVRQQCQQQRLPHALLLTGIDGLGQIDFARELAQLKLCEQPQQHPCGQCRQCHLFTTGSHPDYFCLEPEADKRIIKIDQIRRLIDAVAKTPQLAHSQVVVINTLDQLNTKAANALLKTLEEPSGDVLFILVCQRLGSVPITIISRCQRLHFAVRDEAAAIAWLKQQLPEQQQLDTLLELAYGAPLQAVALAQRDILGLRDQLLKKLLAIKSGDNPLSGVDALLKHDVFDVLMILRSLYDDIRKCQLAVNMARLTNRDRATQLQQCASMYDAAQLQLRVDALANTERVLRDGVHINPQLAVEALLVA